MEGISVFPFVQCAADVFLLTGNVRRVLISRYVEFPHNITRKVSYWLASDVCRQLSYLRTTMCFSGGCCMVRRR